MNRHRRRGAALVEAAVVMPLVIAVTFAVIEYGWMFLKSQEVSNAARHAVRVGVVHNATAADITAAVTTAMTSAGLNASGYTLNIVPADPTTLASGEPLRVEITVPYEGNASVALGFPLIPVPTNLRASVTMAREGP